MNKKRISIFGATGSVGQNTLDLISRDRESYEIVVLTAGSNIDSLIKAALQFKPQAIVAATNDQFKELKNALSNTEINIGTGRAALLESASRKCDLAFSAIVGAAGLEPGLIALENGANLALANKESMVAAGDLVKKTAFKNNCKLIPVDSEHSAIFQALHGENVNSIERVILTASGGAFRDWTIEEIAKATPEQASTHPNWNMGQRITIDSASMFNKALEVIEAKELFNLTAKQIEVLVHPQSLVHAIVGFCDGGMLAHLGPPDMRHAIGYALNYPNRKTLPLEKLDFTKSSPLTFLEPDKERFPAIGLAYDVMALGGISGAVFNAAKETALDGFLAKQIGFLDMSIIVEKTITEICHLKNCHKTEICLSNILDLDSLARNYAAELIQMQGS
ncbi:MAG: 1-deoxy-D-xylulose-5-phosphate reductoisomerase [Paracoccaceae bacterium]|uniref:1-deoxy-D-xylulose-5-phosphate reductoisomerase n=1 Tax=Candidatus Salinivivens marinus TaxID=3381703 RepID=UPI000BE0C75A|nr:MAG: 1-deoxy-D-xylulose-5-phosphate reductoisomerase [Rhodobacteraceae bacterium MED-G08]|tara:strand:- start:1349 stop:2527 length:1179 start_codon:yes stop_codon:yes gene_type:complete